MSESSLIGKAKELYVATLLVNRRLHVFTPLVDNGFDLVVAKRDGTEFIPVQVKYKAMRSGFSLDRKDAMRFAQAGAVLAFGSGEDLVEKEFYFFPAKAWLDHAQAYDQGRKDDKLVVYLTQSADWAARLLSSSAEGRQPNQGRYPVRCGAKTPRTSRTT